MINLPFCVIDRPYMLWGDSITADNLHFLENIDAGLYYRAAHQFFCGTVHNEANQKINFEPKDISSLSRLLWHHAIETLLMMFGAYMQAPNAVHAYFLKCHTEEAICIGKLLLKEQLPKYHRVRNGPFTIPKMLRGIHLHAGSFISDEAIEHYADVLRRILDDFTCDKHRLEYNSIKHGLRTSYGRLAIKAGIEEVPGVAVIDETMELIGFSQNASSFNIARPLNNIPKEAMKLNFTVSRASVSWSLEKVICELQLISTLLHNLISSLRIFNGTSYKDVTFNRVGGDEFWSVYSNLNAGNIRVSEWNIDIDGGNLNLPTDKQIFASYTIDN